MPLAQPMIIPESTPVSCQYECGVDEVARGCLFGRVYAGAVVWLDGASFPTNLPKGVVIRDSKKMSAAQRERAAVWIQANALDHNVAYQTETDIDNTNILEAAIDAMHLAIAGLKRQTPHTLAIDGTQFRSFETIPHRCIPQGDRHHFGIACGAIIAKVAHDAYIRELCATFPQLDDAYGLSRNMGYGTPVHLKGIQEHGVAAGHRKSFGICKTAPSNPMMHLRIKTENLELKI